ncbi:ribosome maturation factor RimP [Halanaerobacter jeridensis]|uniref:Ribosome maturation factor RimP n=1 Tax=Halanaerobacter jeridensis TaxID=706427 RepID=A0A939BPN1_9FIRM|nr:ribosome maturation factor RimP [Halanaerobacter jeridensis]MBM7555384.1 ribosome maturation factor RimP [Halanaerobacter jeridensis]
MSKSVAEEVLELANPIAESRGLELVDVEYNKEGEDWILRVFIDKEGGISLEDCQEVSRDLEGQLDVVDPIEKSYLLEVSSPGLDRPLKDDEDFERFTGRLINISTYAPVDGAKEFTGTLLGLEEGEIRIEVEGEELLIPQNKVAKTKLAVEF